MFFRTHELPGVFQDTLVTPTLYDYNLKKENTMTAVQTIAHLTRIFILQSFTTVIGLSKTLCCRPILRRNPKLIKGQVRSPHFFRVETLFPFNFFSMKK